MSDLSIVKVEAGVLYLDEEKEASTRDGDSFLVTQHCAVEPADLVRWATALGFKLVYSDDTPVAADVKPELTNNTSGIIDRRAFCGDCGARGDKPGWVWHRDGWIHNCPDDGLDLEDDG